MTRKIVSLERTDQNRKLQAKSKVSENTEQEKFSTNPLTECVFIPTYIYNLHTYYYVYKSINRVCSDCLSCYLSEKQELEAYFPFIACYCLP